MPREVDELVVTAPKRPPEPAWSNKLNFDVRGVHSGAAAPYLRKRPTNGCKLMAGGATGAMGEPGAAGGVVCAKSF